MLFAAHDLVLSDADPLRDPVAVAALVHHTNAAVAVVAILVPARDKLQEHTLSRSEGE
jgi:hypothetical protein